MTEQDAMHKRISEVIEAEKVVLFMKGTRVMPQCGFSNTVVQILDSIMDNYQTVNVLADPELRSGIKTFSNWPTIPQLYVKGEFIGGCDIITEMVLNSEFDQLLTDNEINFNKSKANEVRKANS